MQRKASYREVVRLTRAGGYSQREIAAAALCAPSTVADIQRKIRLSGINLDDVKDLGEKELRELFCNKRGKNVYGQ